MIVQTSTDLEKPVEKNIDILFYLVRSTDTKVSFYDMK